MTLNWLKPYAKEMRDKTLIIGAGTAGICIANELFKKKEDFEIFDTAEYKNYPFFFKPPLMIGFLFGRDNFIKENNFYFNDREIPYYIPNIIGGSSEINGCVHSLGSEKSWRKMLEDFNLNFEDIKYAYEENFSKDQKKEKIQIRESFSNDLDDDFFSFLTKRGVPYGNTEFSDTERFGTLKNNSGQFFRSTPLSSFYKIKKLVKKDIHVNNISIDNNFNVDGVFTNKGFFKFNKIILAAGSIGSSRIILNTFLSNKINIQKSIKDLAVKDQPNVRIKFKLNSQKGTLNEIYSSTFKRLILGINYLAGKRSFFTSSGATSAVYLDLDNDEVPDVKIQLVQFTEKGRLSSNTSRGIEFDPNPGFSLGITILNPKSIGRLSISKLDDRTLVKPNYFCNDEDLELCKKAIKFCLEFGKELKDIGIVNEIIDLKLIKNDIEGYIKTNVFSSYHLIGGCTLENGIINKNFNVTDLNNLFICDASVMSDFVSSNSHAPVVCLSSAFAKNIL